MDDASAILVVALLGGLTAAAIRLPPLLGFLAAGFVLHGLDVSSVPALDTVAELGVTLLLFGVGLRLDVRTLVRREVWVTGSVHLVLSTALGAMLLATLAAAGFNLLAGEGWRAFVLIGFALSFSSTVFVVKALEERNAVRSLGGRTAVGILVIQDLAAVLFLGFTADEPPSPWAACLVLLLPAAMLLRRVLSVVGHDELLPLYGLVLALVPGFALFEALGVKGDLGALVIGMLLASHPGSAELAKSLFTVKDLLLVGFFVSVGIGGAPTADHLAVSAALLLLLPLKTAGFAALLWACGLRRRTSVVTGATLTNFSEFGLIVMVAAQDLVTEDWSLVVATLVAVSFVVAAVPARHPDPLVKLARRLLPDRPAHRVHPDDRPLDVGHAQAVVLGMGRVGTAAYEQLRTKYAMNVLGVEFSGDRVRQLTRQGLDVVEGDATDPDYWERLRTGDVKVVLLAMPSHGNNLDALARLKEGGFSGAIAVVAQYDEDLVQAVRRGADAGFQLYDGAGAELADRAAAAADLPHHPR